MKYWIVLLATIISFVYFGYMIGSNLILPHCDNLPQNVNIEDCHQMVNQKLFNYQIQGVVYGLIAGLIIGLIINFIIKKFKK